MITKPLQEIAEGTFHLASILFSMHDAKHMSYAFSWLKANRPAWTLLRHRMFNLLCLPAILKVAYLISCK